MVCFYSGVDSSYGLARARYRGEARNATHFLILATAYNLRRSLRLV